MHPIKSLSMKRVRHDDEFKFMCIIACFHFIEIKKLLMIYGQDWCRFFLCFCLCSLHLVAYTHCILLCTCNSCDGEWWCEKQRKKLARSLQLLVLVRKISSDEMVTREKKPPTCNNNNKIGNCTDNSIKKRTTEMKNVARARKS